MLSTKPFLALSLLGALFATQVSAHGLWTEQRRGNVEVVYGHGAEDNAFKAQKVSGAWAYDLQGKMIPVTVQRLDDHARLVPLKPPAVVSVALDNGMWTRNTEKKWINEGRSKVPDGTDSIHTFKYSVAIYEEGAHLPSLQKLNFVIVPYPIHEPHISSHWLTPDAVLPFSFRSQHHDATRRQSRESLPLSQTRGFQKIHRWLSCFGRVGY